MWVLFGNNSIEEKGLFLPFICTPEELLEDNHAE